MRLNIYIYIYIRRPYKNASKYLFHALEWCRGISINATLRLQSDMLTMVQSSSYFKKWWFRLYVNIWWSWMCYFNVYFRIPGTCCRPLRRQFFIKLSLSIGKACYRSCHLRHIWPRYGKGFHKSRDWICPFLYASHFASIIFSMNRWQHRTVL